MRRIIFLLLFLVSITSLVAQDWNEITKRTASDGAKSDRFGCSVSISGDYAIVGAHQEAEDALGDNTIENA